MIKATDKEKLKAIGLDIDTIIAAANDPAERDIVIPDGQMLTDMQLEARDKVKTDAGKADGETTARTALITEVKNRLNIDVSGDRLGDVVKGISTELAKVSGDAKLMALNDQVAALTKDKEASMAQIAAADSRANGVIFEHGQYAQFPATKSGILNDKQYYVALAASGIEAKADGVYRHGELMKDTATHGALGHKAAYETIFKENNWISEPAGQQGGRGGKNNSTVAGVKANSTSSALEMWSAANPGANPMSASAMNFVQEQAKDNPSFDRAA